VKKLSPLFCFLMIFLSSCALPFQLVRFTDGFTIQGSADRLSKTVTIVMPDGEVLQGPYASVSNSTFSMGFARGSFAAGRTSGTATATGYGYGIGGAGNGYALLKGDRGTMMEGDNQEDL
jgi:hypothetical protein